VTGRRLIVVTGKGGVGKSTVAAALAVAAVRRGQRTVVVEVAASDDVARALGGSAGDSLRETEPYPGMRHVTIDRRAAMEAYLHDEVPGVVPAALLARSRAFELFVAATPGMSDLLTIGKVWELAQRPRHTRGASPYDLVVLDAPASGNVAGLLAAPRTFRSIARVGPIANQCAAIDRTLTDAGATQVVAVATPEQMPVTETLGLRGALSRRLGIELAGVVINRLVSSPFTAKDLTAMAVAANDPAVSSAQWLHGRARAHHSQLSRLRTELRGETVVTLPFLFKGEIGRAEIEHLAGLLERLERDDHVGRAGRQQRVEGFER